MDKNEIMTRYIAPRHFAKLNEYVKKASESPNINFPYIVSFREAGVYSVLMLEAGAAAKPHSILEKTIKDGTIGTITDEEKNCKQLVLLYGLVAKRSEKDIDNLKAGSIAGLYRSNGVSPDNVLRREGKELIDFVSEATDISKNDLNELNNMSKEEILGLMRDGNSKFYAGKYASKYVTGDYDLHDLINKISPIAPIPSDSPDEKRAINDLNSIMRKGTRYKLLKRKKIAIYKDDFNPVQHGPQYNYIAHMYAEEKNGKLVESVAKASLPVLMLNVKGGKVEWTEITSLKDLQDYYEANCVEMKYSWKDGFEKYIAERQCKSLNEHMKNNQSGS